MSRRLRYVVSALCALLSLVLCLAYGEQVRAQCTREREAALERFGGEVTTLVVATEPIEQGEKVDRNNVAERAWVAELAPASALTELDEVIGAEVSVPVAAGVPLTDLNFRNPADAIEVPADKVALTLMADDELGVPTGVAAGTTLAAFEVTDDGVRLITGDLRVLAAPTSGVLASSAQITVAVLPEEVAPLLAASGEGSLRLAMPGEEALGVGEGVPEAPTDVPAQASPEGEPPAGGEPAERGAAEGEEQVEAEVGQ